MSNNAALNEALRTAVHAIANKKLQALASGIKSAANASGAEKNARIKELERLLAEAQAAAKAAGPGPVAPATVNAENAAIKALIKNIGNGKFNTNNKRNVNVNAVKRNTRYRNVNQNAINAAVSKRKENLSTQQPPPAGPPPPLPNKPAIEKYISNLMGNKRAPFGTWANAQAAYPGLANWPQITSNQKNRLGAATRNYMQRHPPP